MLSKWFYFLFCRFCLQLWESALKITFELFLKAGRSLLILIYYGKKEVQRCVTWSPISYSSFFSFSRLLLLRQAHITKKNRAEISEEDSYKVRGLDQNVQPIYGIVLWYDYSKSLLHKAKPRALSHPEALSHLSSVATPVLRWPSYQLIFFVNRSK